MVIVQFATLNHQKTNIHHHYSTIINPLLTIISQWFSPFKKEDLDQKDRGFLGEDETRNACERPARNHCGPDQKRVAFTRKLTGWKWMEQRETYLKPQTITVRKCSGLKNLTVISSPC